MPTLLRLRAVGEGLALPVLSFVLPGVGGRVKTLPYATMRYSFPGGGAIRVSER